MSSLAPLYKELLSVCANGCIPNLKFSSALQNQHAEKAIYHHRDEVLTWAPAAGLKMRMVASKFRDMALDDEILDRCLRKAWVLHKKIDWATLGPLGVYRIFRIWGI